MRAILNPGTIGRLRVANRVVRAAHTTQLAHRAQISEELIAYHERAARGGAGLHMLEIASVHRSGLGPLNIADDRIVGGLAALMDRMRPHGGRVFQQIGHPGPQSPCGRRGEPPWAASPVQPVAGATIPLAMTSKMIEEVVAAFAAGARRVEEAGLDGVEIHAGHGYLLHSFLSPLSNMRDDDYGGDASQRRRFLIEVCAAVRQAVSPDFPVGVRLSPDGVAGGLDAVTLAAVVRALEERSLIDFVDISLGSYVNRAATIGGAYEPAGYQLPTSLPIARATTLPSIVSGRFTTLEEADAVVSRGDAAFVGMTRAQIADPDAVLKIRAGHSGRVRPCIACNACVAAIEQGTLGCAVNPAAGRETAVEPLTAAAASRRERVVVVGGGPAGLEAARAAALRGHEVTVIEREAALGGQLRIGERAPHRERLGLLLRWFERECARLGVDVKLSQPGSAPSVAALRPDRVVLATGANPELGAIADAEAPAAFEDAVRVLSAWEVLAAPPEGARSAVVVDRTGMYEAAAAAERLLLDGVQVTFVTTLDAFLSPLAAQLEPIPALRRLRAHDFALHTRCDVVEIRAGHALLRYRDGGAPFAVAAEIAVIVEAKRSENALAEELAELAAVSVIGDALSPRGLRVAIGEGHRAGTGAWTDGVRS